MNKEKYESLPDDLKAAIDGQSGAEFSRMAGTQMQADDTPSREAALDMGNNLISISEADAGPWREAAAATTDEWIAEMDEKGIDGNALIARANELLEKHNTQ